MTMCYIVCDNVSGTAECVSAQASGCHNHLRVPFEYSPPIPMPQNFTTALLFSNRAGFPDLSALSTSLMSMYRNLRAEVLCPPVPGLDPICLALAQITVLPCPRPVICGRPLHLVSRLLLHSLYSAIPCRRYSLVRGRICSPCIAVYYVEVEKELGFVGVGAPMSGWPH